VTIHGPGSVVRRRRIRLGPLPWSVTTRVMRSLGWTWWLLEEEDTDPGAGASTFAFTFDSGWLTIVDGVGPNGPQSFGDARAAAFGAHLAAVGGRPVVVRLEEAELRPRAGAVATTARITEHTVDGEERVLSVHEHDGFDDDYDLDADWVADESADAIAAELWDEAPLPSPPVPLPARHPELAPRLGHLRAVGALPPVVCGPSVVLGGAGWRRPLDAAARTALEHALRKADALDLASEPPDLARWRDRAARRAGLVAEPDAGTPEHARWAEVFAELTRPERSAPGADGKVAAWKLRTPGRWPLDPSEIARIATCPGVPEAVRLRADVPDWEVSVADDAPAPLPPWSL
jgi:hypothetical protein